MRIKEARIENTNRCNTHCVCCPRELQTRPLVTMPLWHFEGLVNQCRALGVELIQIGGYGEPLLDEDLFRKIYMVKAAGIETFVTTNGSLLLSGMVDDLIDAGLDNLRISIHGATPENYHAVHRLSFEHLMMNLRYLKKKIASMHTGMKIHITCMPFHGEKPEDFVEAFGEYCHFLEVWRPHNWSTGRWFRKASGKRKGCARPFNGPLQILADGRMTVCCMDFDGALEAGDTWKQGIEEIYTGKRFDIIREAHRTGALHGFVCEECDQLYEQETPALIWRSGEGAANRRTDYGALMG